MLGAAVIFQVELWSLRLEISNLFGLGDDDDIDHLLDDVIGNYAAGVPHGQHGLLEPELDELVNDARSAADECWYRL